MKYAERYAAFETAVGKYSARKVPEWRIGLHELQQYLSDIEVLIDPTPSDWD